MPNAAKKSRPGDQGSIQQTQVEQTSAEPDAEEDFDMDQLEDMAALLIDALTIPLPADDIPATDDHEDRATDETPRPPSPRQLQ